MKSQKWIIILGFVAAAIITPTPDPLNQTIIALPIIVIYQLGVAAVLLSIRAENKRQRQARKLVDNSSNELAKSRQRSAKEQPKQLPQPSYATPNRANPKMAIAHQQAKLSEHIGTNKPQATSQTKRINDIVRNQQSAVVSTQKQMPKPTRRIDGFIRTTSTPGQRIAKPVIVPERQNAEIRITPVQRSITSNTQKTELSLDGMARPRKVAL